MKKVLLAALLLGASAISYAQHWTLGQVLPDSVNPVYSATTGSEFGWSMAATDNHVIVGSLVNEVVIYERNTTTDAHEAQVVLTPGVGGFTGFGGAVDIDDSTAVVGARNYMSNGGVFVYRLSGGVWGLEQILTASDGASGDNFGRDVAVSGNKIVVGADGNNSGTGAVYLFSRSGSTWSQDDKYVPADANSGDACGSAVDLKGDTLLCTAPLHYNGTPGHTGAAYACSVAGGTATYLQTFTAGATQWNFNDEFGNSACISENGHMLIGANGSEVSGTDCGAVFAWFQNGSTWAPMAPIVPESPQSGERFGTSIDANNEKVVIGAPGYDFWTGRAIAHALLPTVHFQIQVLDAFSGGSAPSAGQSVAFMNNKVLIGANYASVYVGLNDTGGYSWWDLCIDLLDPSVIWSGNDLSAVETNADSYTWYWIDDSGLFPVPTQVGVGSVHTPVNGGKYYLVMEKAECYVHIEIHVSLVGMNSPTSLDLAIQPNPVSDVLYVNSTSTNGTLEVLSVDGKVVKTEAINGTVSVDVNDLEAGIYILRISESGQIGQTRFVKVE